MNGEFAGLVLSKSLSGERGILYRVFSPEAGLLALYKRVSSKTASALPDIFDAISARVSKASGGDLMFVEEFEILGRRTGLAADYAAFCAACDIARIVAKNTRYLEEFARLHSALEGALDALEAGACADVVKVKFLYVFARDEGYPVKESFARSLDGGDLKLLSRLLSAPSSECGADSDGAARLLFALERWLYSSTDIQPA